MTTQRNSDIIKDDKRFVYKSTVSAIEDKDMVYRAREQSAPENIKAKGFISGIGSILNLSPSTPSAAYKGQYQDLLMMSKDMQKIGNDFKVSIKKVIDGRARG